MMQSTTTIITLNSIMAFIGALLAIGALRSMTKATKHAPRFAIVIILVGLFAQAFGIWTKQWDHYADTLLFGGIVAFMLANKRMRCINEKPGSIAQITSAIYQEKALGAISLCVSCTTVAWSVYLMFG